MYVSETRNCVNVSFTFDKKVAKQALLDSGATDNFIDQRTIQRLNIPTRRSSDLTLYVSVKLGPGPSIQARLKIQIVTHKGVK